MKFAMIIALSVFWSSANAGSTERLIKACERVGLDKLQRQANAFGLSVDPKTFRECGVDNRTMNISSYVWFCAETKGGEKKLKQMTQKPRFQDCF